MIFEGKREIQGVCGAEKGRVNREPFFFFTSTIAIKSCNVGAILLCKLVLYVGALVLTNAQHIPFSKLFQKFSFDGRENS